jgi:excisionase family DNA binding protein
MARVGRDALAVRETSKRPGWPGAIAQHALAPAFLLLWRANWSLAMSENLDVIWGAQAIAKAIGRTPRSVYHLLESGALPARRVGGRWCISRAALARMFEPEMKAA